MTTQTEREALVSTLRRAAEMHGSHHQQADWQRHAQRKAADMLAADAQEITALRKEKEERPILDAILLRAGKLKWEEQEIARLQAELDGIRKQESMMDAEIKLRQDECDIIAEINHGQWLALENIRLLAARHRKEDWAQHMLRFCESAGSSATTLRTSPQQVAVPQGWQLVPNEVIALYNFMDATFVPLSGQQEQIKVSLDYARKTMLAAPPPPQLSNISAEVMAFLSGAGPLDGVWFGEDHPTERGKFWWRKHLVSVAPKPPQGEPTDEGGAPVFWYCAFEKYGQVTMRQNEAVFALKNGAKVLRYGPPQAERVPMTEEELEDGFNSPSVDVAPTDTVESVFAEGARFAERHHGIGAKP